MKPTNINRRNFIKKSGMLLAATSVPSFLQAGEKQPTLSIKNQKIAIDSQWDVIVVGGGPAGCTAATAAAREGAKTLLIEATGQLGGMGTTGMIPAWCPFSDGEKIIYRGLAEKVFRAAKKGVPHEPADKLDWVSINPEQLMTVYDDMVCSSGAKVLFFSRLADVEMASDDTIEYRRRRPLGMGRSQLFHGQQQRPSAALHPLFLGGQCRFIRLHDKSQPLLGKQG